RSLTQPGQAPLEFLPQLLLLGEAVTLLFDDVGRRPFDELRTRQLGLEKRHRVGGTLQLLLEARPLGGQIDHTGELYVDLRRTARRGGPARERASPPAAPGAGGGGKTRRAVPSHAAPPRARLRASP